MGKWTLEYHDEVLRNKVKSLVQGAIKRMKLEEDGAKITYESFVEDLDEGDSFTTSLVDVLVKELAERRTRPNPSDRRLISDRTAKSLRMQAAPLHVYRGSHGTLRDRARRSVPIPPPRAYSAFHDIMSDSDGDDEYGTILGTAGQLEGARLNNDLYDAYLPSTLDLPGSLSRASERLPTPPQPAESVASGAWRTASPPPRSPSTVYTSGPAWTGLGGPGASLSRSSTVRRPPRRTVDSSEFANWTSRRRSAIRNSATRDDGSHEGSSTDTAGRSAELSATPGSRGSHDTWTNRRNHVISFLGSSFGESGPSSSSNPSSSQMWHSMTSASSTPLSSTSLAVLPRRSSTTDINDDRRQAIAPRLRRGGLRPPESLSLHGLRSSSSQELPGSPVSDHNLGSRDSLPVSLPGRPGTSEEAGSEQSESTVLALRSASPVA